MCNKKTYTKIVVLVLVIVGIIGISIYLIFPTSVSAAWFDDSFAYRKYISFTHNAALTDRRVTITVDTATLITAGKMQSDCDDTRFTDVNGKVLRYQLTGTCNNAATTYDVVFPTILNGLNAGYIYYGNASATSASDAGVAAFTSLSPSGGAAAQGSEEKGETPVLYWSLNDANGTTVQDTSTNNNDGTSSNATWKTADDCYSNSCLQFDGSGDSVSKTYSSDTELNPSTTDFSVELFFKHPTAISANEFLVSRFSGSGYKIYMNSTGNICFGIDDDSTWTPDDAACTTATYNDNNWHFLTAVKSGTTSITVYIDGNQQAQDATIAATSTISGSSPTIYLGIDSDGTSSSWNGFIDEFKVFNYAKSVPQIKLDLAAKNSLSGVAQSFGGANTSSLTQGLLGWWKTDEGTGTSTTADASGNSLTGNLTAIDSGDWVAGKFRFGLDMDGSAEYIDMNDPSSGILDFADGADFTLSAWIYNDTVTTEDVIMCKKNIPTDGSAGYCLMRYANANGGVICLYIADGTDTWEMCSSSTVTTAATWNHVVAVVNEDNPGESNIYVNGQPTKNTTLGTMSNVNSLATNEDFRIGSYGSGAAGQPFDGRVDDSRIYNRALSPSEVRQLYDYAPGPVGYWKFDENTGTTANDLSGNSNTSSTYTGDVKYTSGKFGTSAQFDGVNDVVRIVESTTLDLGGTAESYTVGAWVKMPTTANCDSGDCYIVTKYDGVASTLPFMIALDSSERPYFEMLDGTNDVFSDPTATAAINDNEWHYLAGVRNVASDRVEFYVDGVLKSTASDTTTATTKNDADVSIGNGSVSYVSNDFQGYIDEVKIYNYPRTQNQILEDMNAGHPIVGTPVSGPAGHWSLDEGNGTTAQDKSPNDNDLTLSTASWTNDGKLSKAWNGTGALWLSRADDADFDFIAGADFSLSAWVRSDSASNPAASEYIISKETSSAGYALWFNTGGEIVCGIDDDATSFPEDSAGDTASNTDYYDTTWHHVICNRKTVTGRLELYIDGKLFDADTSLSATGDLSNTDSLTIGDRNATNDTDDFNGDIDEVKIYRAALSPSDVLAEYAQGKTVVLGATSTASDGTTISNASAREYCVPGDTSTCNAPVAEWKFDEWSSTSAFDTSTNGVTGTLTGNATWRTGKLGKGVFVDGTSDYVSMGSNVNMTNSDAFSISLWFYPTAATNNNTFLLNKGGTGATAKYQIEWYSTASGGNACLTVHDGTNSYVTCTADNTVDTLNRWYHLTAVYDNASTAGSTIYLNGVDAEFAGYETGNPSTVGSPTNTYGLCIGTEGAIGGTCGTSSEFTGIIDNVRIYRYARTAAQVAWEYNRGAPIAHYKFDECSGSTIYDSSVTGNGATGGRNGTFYFGANTYTSAGTCSSGTSSHMWNAGTTGKYSSAGAFDGGVSADGDTHVRLPNDTFDSLSQGTIALWFKPSNTGDDVQYLFFAAEDDNGTGSDYLGLLTQNSTQSVAAYIRNNAGDAVVAGSGLSSYTSWHHLAYAVNSSGNKMYIDGKQITPTYSVGSASSTEFFDDISENTTAYTLGCTNTDGSDTNDCTGVTLMYEGLMDDVRVYPYALTAAQIKTVYNENSAARFGP